jgi:predicted MPP superfamily phosphohydrolase
MIVDVRARVRWLLWILAVTTVGLSIWVLWWEPSRVGVERVDLVVQWDARGPLRIAVLSDLHVGSPFNGLDKLARIVRMTNDEKPDLICLLGDLVIQGVAGGSFVPPEDIARALGGLTAPLGVVAVLGNHDAWLDHTRVSRALAAYRVRVVEDTAIQVDSAAGPLWIAGVSDRMTRAHDLPAALAAITDDQTPALLLTHNPDVFPDVPSRIALTLAGHTHGGQVDLPIAGRLIVPSAFGQRFAAGHVIEGGRHLFVTTGLGTSILPVRFRVPPVISILTVNPSR